VLLLDERGIDRLLSFLRLIESLFTEKYTDESKKAKKIDQFMKYWLWIRRGADAGGVSYIMRMVEDCDTNDDLVHLVFDLYQHVDVWCKKVDISCSGIDNNSPLHPIFPKISEGWKMFLLAVKTARQYDRPGYSLSDIEEKRLLNLMSWWYLIEYSHNGVTNTTPFRSLWAGLAHRTWHHSAFCNLEWDGWDDESFADEVAAKIGDFQFEKFPSLKSNSFTVNDKDAKPAMVVLGQFERCSGEGLRTSERLPVRQGKQTRDTNLVHLVPPKYLTPALANSIGNRTLVLGSGENGRTVSELEQELENWPDAEDQLNGLIGGISLLSRTDAWPRNLNNPAELKAFIEQRNSVILRVLNSALHDFTEHPFTY